MPWVILGFLAAGSYLLYRHSKGAAVKKTTVVRYQLFYYGGEGAEQLLSEHDSKEAAQKALDQLIKEGAKLQNFKIVKTEKTLSEVKE